MIIVMAILFVLCKILGEIEIIIAILILFFLCKILVEIKKQEKAIIKAIRKQPEDAEDRK